MKRSASVILVHGGAGLQCMTSVQAACLVDSLVAGYDVLKRGGPALAAVEEAIRLLEVSGLFNAGIGSRRQLDGIMRMDASLMEGRDLRAGAVASIEGIVHPIIAARHVMNQTTHVLLVGQPATAFAKHLGLDRQTRTRRPRNRSRLLPGRTLSTRRLRLYRSMMRRGLAVRERYGKETVGAVALDRSGTVAAGASTGGIDLMLPGRVGDTPLIGCGVYADNRSGAVSMTGLGESIMRIAAAKEITDRLEKGESPAIAARAVFKKLVRRTCGAAGALILSADGRFAIKHTTPRMAAGYWNGSGKPVVKSRFQ